MKRQVINSNFTLLIQQVEQYIKDGYSVVYDGVDAPYHMVMGSFIVTLDNGEKEVQDVVETPVVTETQEKIDEAKQTRGRSKK